MAVFKSRADAIIVPGQFYDPGNDISIDENNSSPTNPIRRVNPNLGQEHDTSDMDKRFGDFGGDDVSGYSTWETQSYKQVYDVVKDYPQWLALLKANPYIGFTAPMSFWDNLGLSSKAKDKLAAYQQAYKEYNADVLAKFMSWKNSLPETQREQQVQAGYNPDTIDVQPSSLSSDAPVINADPTAIESDSTGQQYMAMVGAGLSLISAAISGGTSLAMTSANLVAQGITNNKIKSDTEAQNLANYQKAYDIAKIVYGETSDPVKVKPGELKPSRKFALQDAPKSINDMLNAFQNTRGFDTKFDESVAAATSAQTGIISADMDKVQTEVLYGDKETWQELRDLHAKASKLNLDNTMAYLELYDPLLSAGAQNKYNTYMRDFYMTLNGVNAGESQNDYVANLRKSLEANKIAIECKMKMVQIKSDIVDKLFDKAVNGDWLESKLAKGALTAADIASDYFGVAQPSATPNSAVTGSSFGLPTISLPKLEH